MNKKSEIKLALALLFAAFLYCGSVSAQVPVTDSQNVKSTIKNWFTNIKESKVVVSTMNTAKKTSAAIGTAKKAVSEYVVENKKKIEEKMAKVKEYKEKAEQYKKDYEEYKKQLDEGIAKAKEYKEKAEEGIQTAKDTVAAAKDMASAAKDMADSKIASVNDKLGASSKENTSDNVGADTQSNEATASEEATQKADVMVQAQTGMTAGTVSTTRKPFVSTAVSAGAVAASTANTGNMVTAETIVEDSGLTPQMLSEIQAADAAALSLSKDSQENSLNIVPSENSEDATAKEKAVEMSGEAMSVDTAVSTQGKAIGELQKESLNKELSKRSQQVSPAKNVESMAADKISSSAVQLNTDKAIAQPSIVTKDVSKTEAVTRQTQPAVQKAIDKTSQSQLKKVNSSTFSAQKMQKSPSSISVQPQRRSLRKTFTTSSLQGEYSISKSIPVGFAFALELPDDCSDVNNTRLFPRTTCMYCNLSSSKVKESGAVDSCLQDINKESSTAQAYSGKDAPTAYRKGKLEIAATMIAESYRAANKAETFYDNKVAPIAEAPEAVEQDALANLVEFNKVIDEQLNDLILLYSSKLALQAYINYGEYKFKPEEESDEE